MKHSGSNVKMTVEIAVVATILVASLGLRLAGLDAFVVNDEMRWTCRSIGFQEALMKRDWASTFRTGHPGVVTTWLGTIFIPYEAADAEAREACQITPDASELSESGDTPAERTDLMHRVRDLLFRARRGVALFTWLSLIGIYLLTRHLWGIKVALLSLVLMAIDPFYLALSRILHVDGALTSTMTLSVLSLVASLRSHRESRRRIGLLVLSGAMAGLAILQKSPAMFLGPFALLLVLVDHIRRGFNRRLFLQTLRDLVIWGLMAGLVYVALWPTMWVQPVETMRQILAMALGYAAEGHSSGNYFMGQPTEDPGWLFYPVATPFRLSPLVLVGLIAVVAWIIKRESTAEKRNSALDLLLYGVAFGAFMTLGDKMFDRYLVPIYPSLEIVSAVGLWWMLNSVQERLEGAWAKALSPVPVAALALALQLVITVPHYPHYLTYYNPLLGGIHQAKKLLLVGWGEGYERAAAYLNDKPNAEALQVIMPAFPVFAPQFDGTTRSMEQYSDWGSDYVMFYLSHVQRQRYGELMTQYLYNPRVAPERVFSLHGVDYIWLYHNDHYAAPIAYLEQHGEPDEEACILANKDSLFVKYYEGDLRLLTFDTYYDTEEDVYVFWTRNQMAALLEYAPSACERIWYLSYPEQEDQDYSDLLRKRAIVRDQATFPLVELTLYELVGSGAKREPVNLQFGDLMLRSFAQTSPSAAWGRDGGLVLEWEALQPLEEDYSTFLHVYNAHGQRIAQGDTLITDKNLEPTSQWEAESENRTVYHLDIPPETPPGAYSLDLGVYLLDTGERLPLVNGEGESQETSATLEISIGVPDQAPDAVDLPISTVLEQDLTSGLQLLGYSLEHREVLGGEPVPVRLFWRALSPMDEDYRLQLSLRDDSGTLQGMAQTELLTTNHPTTEWRSGETLGEWYYLSTEGDLPTGDMSLAVNLLDDAGHPVLPQPVDLTTVWIQSRTPSYEVPKSMATLSGARLGDGISILGYEVEQAVRPGQDLEVTVAWQALREMDTSYKVFVHLYDEQGGILGQQDRIPGLGARPTSSWESREVVLDRYRIAVPHDVPAGTYPLAVGLYDPETGERLRVTSSEGGILDHNRVSLGHVEIKP